LKEAGLLLSTPVHCSLAMPNSHSHLPSFSHFTASFYKARLCFSQFKVPEDVLQDVTWWYTILEENQCHSQLQ
ncbi:hypothetical protein M422DRAFT_187901, partial [Sphaerobolus stellatus SS14]